MWAVPWRSWDPSTTPPDDDLIKNAREEMNKIPRSHLALYGFVSGSFFTIVISVIHKRYFRRIKTSEWVTPDVFAKRRWIRGVVTNVGDADNFRLYHTPGFGWGWPLKFRRIPSTNKDLKYQTLHIRIAGVDAPEASHFGRPAQPYSEESLSWLKDKISGKTVSCQLLHRDQYSRIVASVVLPPRFFPRSISSGKSLALEMLAAGCATTYEQAGADYGRWGKDAFIRAEANAKAARRGIWKRGVMIETPAEYKRRYAQPTGAADSSSADIPGSGSGKNLNASQRQGRISKWFMRGFFR